MLVSHVILPCSRTPSPARRSTLSSDTPRNSVEPHLHERRQLRPRSVCARTPVTFGERRLFLDCPLRAPQCRPSVRLQPCPARSAASKILEDHPRSSTAADRRSPGASAPQKKLEQAVYAPISSDLDPARVRPSRNFIPLTQRTPRRSHGSLHSHFVLFLFMRTCAFSLLLHLLLTGHQAFSFVV